MGLKGQMGVSGNIERPRTTKQKKDAEARKKMDRKKFEYYTQYKCTHCERKTEHPIQGAEDMLCPLCFHEGKGVHPVEKTKVKGKRLIQPLTTKKKKHKGKNKKPKPK